MASDIKCPVCGSSTRLRTRREDGSKFHVCVNWPECKGKVAFEDEYEEEWGDDWDDKKPVSRTTHDRDWQRSRTGIESPQQHSLRQTNSQKTAKPLAEFVSGHPSAVATRVLLVLYLVATAVAIWMDIDGIDIASRLVSGSYVSLSEATRFDTNFGSIGIAQLLVFIMTSTAFCVWIHRVYKNLPALNAKGLKYSPGWAVGWFFVPIMCLFRPYQVTSEIWKASNPDVNIKDGLDWKGSPSSPLLPCWWLLWILSGIVGNIVGRLYLSAEDVDSLVASYWGYLVVDILDVVATALLIAVITKIDKRQREKNALLNREFHYQRQ